MSVHHTRLNKIYEHMKDRCYNPNFHCYNRYGGRGITICKEWLEDYQTFKAWALSHGYSDNLTLDRIDNDKGYYPENCRWITLQAQCDNTRKSICIAGRNRSLTSWCKLLGLNYNVVRYRLKKGYRIEDALELN